MPDEGDFAPRDDTVMVSRSFAEWEEYRAELIKAIESAGLKPAVLGHYELTNAGVTEASLRLVETSGALALIIGEKYGSIPDDAHLNPNQLSLAELEFDHAVRLGKPVVAFITEEPPIKQILPDELETETKLEAFKNKLEPNRAAVYYFETLVDFRRLAARVLIILSRYLKSQLEPPSSPERESRGFSDSFYDFSALEGRDPTDQPAEAVASERPLVFISASHEDMDWRELLERTLDEYRLDIEWWDISRLPTGTRWEDEIEKMIARAQVAVLLLSPDYLASRNAIAEMVRLQAQSKSGRLKLFPIVVRECDWQNVPEIRGIQIWGNGRSLESLNLGERIDHLNGIATSILELIGKGPARVEQPTEPVATDSITPTKLKFSPDALTVMDMARLLATRSNREQITSSCLLFGFAEATTSSNDAAQLVRNLLVRTGQYDNAYQAFMTDAGKTGAYLTIAPIGKTSPNAGGVLHYAKKIVAQVSPGSETIYQRHLLAALMSLTDRKGQLKAHKRLKAMGIERSQYLGELLEFIQKGHFNENLAEWEKILSRGLKAATETTLPPFLEGPAGYTAEFCGVGGTKAVADYLFVGTHADRLAELIALRETKLPLAIGLFGNWGSGKSHFMNLMDRRLKALMEAEKERSPTAAPKWCREIVPIYFNAWHYLDSNLWASLVSQIFESLFTHLRPKSGDLAAVQKLLEEASGATARAAEEVDLAQTATEQARIDLQVAKENRVREETTVDALLHGLRQLLPQVKSDELQHQVADVLGVSREIDTLNDLRQVSREARTFGSRVKRSWNNLLKEPGRGWRIIWLVVALIVVPALSILAVTYLPLLKDWFDRVGRMLAGLLTALPALVVWLRFILKKGNEQLDQIEVWINQAKAAQDQARETPQVVEATMNVTAATAREEAARSRLAQAEAREQQLIEEARGLHPERRLGRYIELRAQSSDYRGQLGLVSLARRDFQELSDLFADAEALQEKVARLQTEQKETEERAAESRASLAVKQENEAKQIEAEAGRLEERAKDLKQQGERIEKLSASIDRIVLFVDDLDRCQPQKIVEILQAVHLLLAFPLFAVVVGVDQRALRQSLRTQFKGLLEQGATGNGAKIDDEHLATPLDYLEKIFHVPFHLPVMGKDGFAELINKLSEPPKADSKSQSEEKGDVRMPPPAEPVTETPRIVAAGGPAVKEEITAASREKTLPDEVIQTQPIQTEMIGSVPLQDWERKALGNYSSLIHTPRGATRLLNTYRLVRAGVPKQEWEVFSSGGEYRVAMLLLAAAAGYPATVRDWFEELRKDNGDILAGRNDPEEAQTPGWDNFKLMYQESLVKGADNLPKETIVKWIERVQRFTF